MVREVVWVFLLPSLIKTASSRGIKVKQAYYYQALLLSKLSFSCNTTTMCAQVTWPFLSLYGVCCLRTNRSTEILSVIVIVSNKSPFTLNKSHVIFQHLWWLTNLWAFSKLSASGNSSLSELPFITKGPRLCVLLLLWAAAVSLPLTFITGCANIKRLPKILLYSQSIPLHLLRNTTHFSLRCKIKRQ